MNASNCTQRRFNWAEENNDRRRHVAGFPAIVAKAWIAEQVPQCGYCQSGQIMQAASLLAKNSDPTKAEVVAHMDGNLCRCMSYVRIQRAILRAAAEMRGV